MAQALYFSLLLIALCSLSECSQRCYHHINMKKTWTEAQRYCRQNYTDLATVNNMNDMKQLMKTLNNTTDPHIWIGLKNTGVYKWKWSLGDPVIYQNWENTEINNKHCAFMRNGTWRHQDCNVEKSFICFNETSKGHIIVTSTKTWRDAQIFCRGNHTDLTSVRNQTDNQHIHNIINDTHTEAWIGLFSDSGEWSDNSDSAFRYWQSGQPNGNVNGIQQCAVTEENEAKNIRRFWGDTDCGLNYTFVCHEDKLILVKEKMNWTEALIYCRKNHVDLVSVDSEEIQIWVTEVIQQSSTDHVWLGLRHSCGLDIWFWVSGEIVCYENWAPGKETADDCGSEVRSGAVQSGEDHHWINLPESNKLNFICRRKDKE